MAQVRLRLFAAARDVAGRASDDLEASTVGEALDIARARFGDDFAAVVATARVWVNGDEPEGGDAAPLRDGDEVAVIPPVSGG
jgi:molybdopterin synthase sulfur carrier subunit